MFRNLLSSLERHCLFAFGCSAKSSSNICFTADGLIISFALSSTTKSILKFSVGMLSCAKILLHEEKTDESGEVMISLCLIVFGQLQPIRRPISMLASNFGILSLIFLRWDHLSAISGVGI